MLYLFLAVLCGTLLSVCFKIFRILGIDSLQGIFVNYLTAIAVSLLLSGEGFSGMGRAVAGAISAPWLPLAVLEGALFMGGILVLAISTQKSGIAVTNVAARASLILPVAASWAVYREGQPRWILITLVILSMFLIFGNIGKGEKFYFRKSALPLLVFLIYGACDFFLKALKSRLGDGSEGDIMLFIFGTAALCCLAVYLARGRFAEHPLNWKALPGGIALGLFNSSCTALMMKALGLMDGVVFFPLYNVGVVCLSIFTGVMFFGERLSRIQIAGIILALVCLVLFLI